MRLWEWKVGPRSSDIDLCKKNSTFQSKCDNEGRWWGQVVLSPTVKKGKIDGMFFLHPSFYLQLNLVWSLKAQTIKEGLTTSKTPTVDPRTWRNCGQAACLTLQHKQSLQQREALLLSSSLFFFPNLPLLLVCQHFSIRLPGRVGLSQRLTVVQLAQKRVKHSWGRVSGKSCNGARSSTWGVSSV